MGETFDAIKDVDIVDIFKRIEPFFHRLRITPAMAMMDVIVEIMFEVLTILAITLHFLCRDRRDKGSEAWTVQ